MKIEWQSLSYALISSIIVTGISGIILSINQIIFGYWNPFSNQFPMENLSEYYDNKISITLAEAGYGPPYILPIWVWILIFLICIIVLTIVFYFVINYFVEKRKKFSKKVNT